MPAFLAASPAIKLLGIDITSQVKNQLAGAIGISGNRLKTPAALVKEREAKADALKEKVYAGDRAAWEQLWQASGRTLPIKAVMSAAVNGSAGWPRVKPYLQSVLLEIESKYGSSGQPPAPLPTTFGIPNLPTLNFTDQLPAPVKDAADKAAKAIGTTTSTLTWIALGVAAVAVVVALRRS